MKKNFPLIAFIAAIFSAFNSDAQITGTVFHDVNGNGTQTASNPIENGVQGVIVNVYNAVEILSGTTTSGATGTYSVSPSGSGPFRVEFIVPASLNYFETSASGAVYGTAVRFVASGTLANVNLALFQRGNYARNTNPSVTGIRQFEGQAGGANAALPVVFKTTYLVNGYNYAGASTALPAGSSSLATMLQVGTVNGAATQPSKGKVYVAAYHKRYCGFGGGGPSTIYQIDTAGTGVTGNINLSTLTGVPNVAGTDVHDFVARAQVGGGTEVYDLGPGGVGYGSFAATATRSLGDLEISGDEKNLYAVNLFTKQIYSLNIESGVAASTSLLFTWNAPDATGAGRHRPFALKWFRGLLYVGSVDENGSNAYVHSFNPNLASPVFNLVLTIPLNYNRQALIGNANGPDVANWRAWTSDPTTISITAFEFGYPQAILSDIQFDAGNNMILGFRDRFGDQGGYEKRFLTTHNVDTYVTTAGDLLRACINAAGTGWVVEAGAGCATANGLVNSGPGGATLPEHYEWDMFQQSPAWDVSSNTGGFHWETSQGSLAQLPGSDVVLTTGMDPTSDFSGGFVRFTNSTGRREGVTTNSITGPPSTGGYSLYETGNYTTGYPVANGSFGKSNGLGDVELLNLAAPAEVGNRVWNDTNGDGIQTAGEPGINAVDIDLYTNGVDGIAGNGDDVFVATVTTDANGNYYFTSASGTNVTGINYNTSLQPNTSYNVRIKNSDWAYAAGLGSGTLAGFRLSATDVAGAGQVDFNDNDAILNTVASNLFPMASFTTGSVGFTTHEYDFGFTQLGMLGNRVWSDDGAGGGTGSNGVQDGAEPGVAGITVTLYRNGVDGLAGTGDDVLVGSTLTDAYGNYQFNNLALTDLTNATTIAQTSYNIKVTAPPNYVFTLQTNTTDDNNTTGISTTGSDVNVLGVSYGIQLTAGENNPNIDAGLILRPALVSNSIGNRVWFDTDGGGTQNGTEPGIAGVTVTLYAADGTTIIAITTTDANGNYLFNNVPANTNFVIGFSAPQGTAFTISAGTTTANGSTDSDADMLTGKTAVFSSGALGTQITGIDAGIVTSNNGFLGDLVWNDLNHNGVQDAGEPGVYTVTMQLYSPGLDGFIGGGDDVLMGTTVTNANGVYNFSNLSAGTYFVVATVPSGYSVSSADAVNAGGDTKDSDFGSGSGPYASNYVSGIYTLNTASGVVSRDTRIDLGVYNNASNLNSIGDKVWDDLNGNGLQDGGEPGVGNISVALLSNLGSPVNNPATGKPYVVSTDANGNYRFVDVADGSYMILFGNIPAGYSVTLQDGSGSGAPGSGTDGTNDSDVKTTTGLTGLIDVDAAGANPVSLNITNVDGGIIKGQPAGTSSLGNSVWVDLNNNGVRDGGEPGVPGVRVELLDVLGNAIDSDPLTAGVQPYVVYTNGLGEYLFTGLAAGDYTVRFSNLPTGYTSSALNSGSNDEIDSDAGFSGSSTGATTATTGIYTLQTGQDNLTVDMGIVPATGTNSVGNIVWNDANQNGIQDVGESGVQGVTVSLYTNGGDGIPGTSDDVLVRVVATDELGRYMFAGLVDGNYNIGYTNLPAGFGFTSKDAAGSTAIDGSDANQATGRTTTVALDPAGASSAAVNNTDVDAGIYTTRASLGNYVWNDVNGNGVQDSGEPGISGVTVTLYAADGSTVLASAVTGAGGNYLFSNLTAGTYVVGFTTLPGGMEFTQQNTPGDNGNNTNSDANTSTGKTMQVVLTGSESDQTIDAGIRRPLTGAVGNLVWNDVDQDGVQDVDEPGLPGILVTLYNSSNVVVGTAVTDGNGNYLIGNVTAGSGYYIIFSNLPSGTGFTTQTGDVSSGDVTLGSDANIATGQTPSFSITALQTLTSVDAGVRNLSAVPLRRLEASAVLNGNRSQVKWITENEVNTAHFEVERSVDGRVYQTVGNKNAAGDYAGVRNYELWDDVSGLSGVVYYRVKLLDRDGGAQYSNVVKLRLEKNTEVKVWPNPFVSKLELRVMSDESVGAQLELMDGSGRRVRSESVQLRAGENQYEIKGLQSLARGLYTIKISTTNGSLNFVKQFTKQ